jgi:hypothetical protein
MTKIRIGLILLSFIIVFSCKKKDDNSVLGLDVQPENDLVGVTVTDSVSLYMYTQKVESVRSYNDRFKYLGSNLDPIFGRTDASIYTNFSISNNLTNLSFGANPVLDSAEIIIRYTGEYKGDTATSLTFQVHILNQKLDATASYSTSSTVPFSSSMISNVVGTVKPRGEDVCLILPLDHNLAEYILKTNSNLANNTVFQNAYKGLYITTANSPLGGAGSGSIRAFDLDDAISGINIYYHDGNSVNSKGQKFLFSFSGSEALRFNHVNNDYTKGATQNLFEQLNSTESIATVKANSNVYINSFGGTRTKVYLPYLKNLVDSQNVSISRAELIIKVDDIISPSNLSFGYPANLALLACREDGTEELVYDQLEASDFVKYGGNYDKTNKQYVFNIARQVQKILTDKITNYGFYLVNATPSVGSVARRDNRLQRVVFGGKTNLNFKPIFKVTYIKYPYDK